MKNISSLYNEQLSKNPQAFFFIEPRSYNFDNPLVLSFESMQNDYFGLKNDSKLEDRTSDLFFLFNNSLRFESQKCQFMNLAEKKKYDLRPYLNLTHECYKKYRTNFCEDAHYMNMSPEREVWTKSNAIDLCLSFSKTISCNQEYKVSKMKNALGEMIRKYQGMFETDRYAALFRLKPTHNKYSCAREGETITMTLKIYAPSFIRSNLRELLDSVENAWTRGKFSLKTEIVDTPSADAIRINKTTNAVSYVLDDDNRAVFISDRLDIYTLKRVIAHEFGHVLGFPDCYIEFFDNKKKELVYYEISKNYTNIMCSMKNGVSVPDEYFDQLVQNSCLFN